MDCKECHERFRADKLIEDFCEENGIAIEGSVDGWSQEEMKNFIEEHNVPCPTCGKHNFTDIRQFNLMFKKLNEGAEKIYAELSKKYNCEFDDRGNIGKRYRRQDEIGTPFCVTYDFDSETDGCVTVRFRDSMEQERVAIADLDAYFADKFTF